jgi:hypothetical protein
MAETPKPPSDPSPEALPALPSEPPRTGKSSGLVRGLTRRPSLLALALLVAHLPTRPDDEEG